MNNKSDMCRICMEGNCKNNIFRTIAAGDLIANLLIDLADIEVDSTDPLPLPNCICDVCQKALVSAIILRKQIRSSDTFLRDLFSNCDLPILPLVTHSPAKSSESNNPGTQAPTISLESVKKEDVAEFEEPPTSNLTSSIPDEDHKPQFSSEQLSWSDQMDVNEELQEIAFDLDLARVADFEQIDPPAPLESRKSPQKINCCRCSELFETRDEIKHHLYDIHNIDFDPSDVKEKASFLKNVAHCDLCGNRYSSAFAANQHKFQYKNLVTCTVCGTLIKKTAINAHLKRHNDDMVTCDVCNKTFRKFYLPEHKKKVHFVVKKFQCYFCPDLRFATKNKIRIHMHRHDPSYTKNVVAVCPYCLRTFETHSQLVNHLVIHTGNKRFICEHCSAAFLHKTDWRRHCWTHTGSPFSCKKCNKYMDRPSHLRAHEKAGCGVKKNKSK